TRRRHPHARPSRARPAGPLRLAHRRGRRGALRGVLHAPRRPPGARMSDQFVGEIRLFPFNFAPRGWAFCKRDLLPISQNTALFSLLGTLYGGNGTSPFALPDLRGRAPMALGQGAGLTMRALGEVGGQETVTLTTANLPAHTHALSATG